MGGAGEQVGGGGSHEDEVCLLSQPHVGDFVHVLPHLGGDRLAGERRPGGLAHEAERVPGGDHPDVVPGLGETAQQFADLVGGDPPAYTENDPGCALSRHRWHRPFLSLHN